MEFDAAVLHAQVWYGRVVDHRELSSSESSRAQQRNEAEEEKTDERIKGCRLDTKQDVAKGDERDGNHVQIIQLNSFCSEISK